MRTFAVLAVAVVAVATVVKFSAKASVGEKDTPLIRMFPTVGTQNTSTGPQDVPFHAYAAKQHVVFGKVPLAKFQQHFGFDMKEYEPFVSVDGFVPLQIWVQYYSRSTCGEYREFIVSATAFRKGTKPSITLDTRTDAAEKLIQLMLHPETTSFIGNLWLDSNPPIAYGREILGLHKFEEMMTVKRWDLPADLGAFDVDTTFQGKRLAKMHLSEAPGVLAQSMAMGRLTWNIGLKTAVNMAVADAVPVGIVSAPGTIPGVNSLIHSVVMLTGTPTLQVWDPSKDTLELGDGSVLGVMDFEPIIVQRTYDGQFAYLPPYDLRRNP